MLFRASVVHAGERRQEPERDGVHDLHLRLLWPLSLYAWTCNASYTGTSFANPQPTHDYWASVSKESFLRNHSTLCAFCAIISWPSILKRTWADVSAQWHLLFLLNFRSGFLRLTLSKLEPNEFECGIANRFSISLQILPLCFILCCITCITFTIFLEVSGMKTRAWSCNGT